MAIKHKIRNRSGKLKTVELTARKAILEFCKECMGWDYKNVKTCTAKNCPLYPFRWYRKPEENIKGDIEG